MNPFEMLSEYLSQQHYAGLVLEIFGALLLGLLVGYERSYRGRAAGMRTYGFVCMASCALTAMVGYQKYWFGGQFADMPVDPTRLIQGIITGIGFLGAGVIMRDGLNISGLTTAASIWAVSAVGVLVGAGLYIPAVFLASSLMAVMMWGSKIEIFFPTHHAVAINLHFLDNVMPSEETLRQLFMEHGYRIAKGSFATAVRGKQHEWRFVVVSMGQRSSSSLIKLGQALSALDDVKDCHLSYSRN